MKLGKALRQAADYKYAHGQINAYYRRKVFENSQDTEVLDGVLVQLESNDSALGAIDWSAIKQWIIDNWPTILRLVLSIAVLLEEGEEK